jgi:hypothetical protein
MPKFSYRGNFDECPPGIYAVQVVRAKQSISKAGGNPMITLTFRILSEGYELRYRLVFSENTERLVCQFCKHGEDELRIPQDPTKEFSLTPADCLYRVAFVEVVHEKADGQDEPDAANKFGGIMSRAKALAKNPELANVKFPRNIPPAKDLPIIGLPRSPISRLSRRS